MKRILDNCSRLYDRDGWAIVIGDSDTPLRWTFCTTRQECRELRKAMAPDMYGRARVVPVTVSLQVVS